MLASRNPSGRGAQLVVPSAGCCFGVLPALLSEPSLEAVSGTPDPDILLVVFFFFGQDENPSAGIYLLAEMYCFCCCFYYCPDTDFVGSGHLYYFVSAKVLSHTSEYAACKDNFCQNTSVDLHSWDR